MTNYQIERTGKLWHELLLDVVSDQRGCRRYTLPLHFAVADDDRGNLTIGIDGHHRMLDAAPGAGRMRFAELPLADAVSQCEKAWAKGVVVQVDFIMQSAVRDGDRVGTIKLMAQQPPQQHAAPGAVGASAAGGTVALVSAGDAASSAGESSGSDAG